MTAPASASSPPRFRPSDRAVPLGRAGGGSALHGYAWPCPAPGASLVLLHGLQSHAQWFAEGADALRDRGCAVYAPDRRGSGTSPGPRGDIRAYGDWLDDVARVVELARAEHRGVPVHLVGHCFGANLALACALRGSTGVGSVVMLTPGLYIQPDYGPVEKAQIALASVLRPEARFRVPQDDALFTRDPAVLAWIRQDSLGARTVTARCLIQIDRMVRWLRRNVGRIEVPVLVLEATRDRISDNRRTRALLGRALPDRCRFVAFDAEHFLLAEPCREAVVDTLAAWAAPAAGTASARTAHAGTARPGPDTCQDGCQDACQDG